MVTHRNKPCFLKHTRYMQINEWLFYPSGKANFMRSLNKHALADKSLPIYSLSDFTDRDKLSIIRPNLASDFMERTENRSFLVECGSLNNILLLKSFRPYVLFVSPLFQISCSFAFFSVTKTSNVVLSCGNALLEIERNVPSGHDVTRHHLTSGRPVMAFSTSGCIVERKGMMHEK